MGQPFASMNKSKKLIFLSLGLIITTLFSGCQKDVEACFSHRMGFENLEVHFNASCSINADAYDWDFGMGQGVSAISEEPTAYFPSAGEYPVTLRITSKKGEVSTVTEMVNVY